MCWQVIRQLWLPDGAHVHLLLSTCLLCPGRCRTTPSSPCSRRAYRPGSGMEKRLSSTHTKNQSLLFSSIQRPPVICNEYKALIVARATLALFHLVFMSPGWFAMMAGVTYKPAGCLGVNHFTVALHWKKNGSWFVRVCLPSFLSRNAPWERDLTQPHLLPDCKVHYFCINSVLWAHRIRQEEVWLKCCPSSVVLSSVSKVAHKCLFRHRSRSFHAQG